MYEPIVTRELWNKVQEVLRSRAVKKPRHVKHRFAFSNLISCSHCGCSIVGEIQKGKYIYYHCTGSKGDCPKPYVREELLEEKFTELLRGLVFDEEGIMILELAERAPELFETQEAREKRRLLDFLLSNCTWDGETFVPEFRQPFDMIADAATECAAKEAAEGGSDDLCQLMGG